MLSSCRFACLLPWKCIFFNDSHFTLKAASLKPWCSSSAGSCSGRRALLIHFLAGVTYLINSLILLYLACALSELSSLHEGESGFRQTYRNIQKNALPAIPDHDTQPEPQRYRENRSPEPQSYRDNPPSPHHYHDDPDPEPRHVRDEPLPPRRYSDDPPSSSQSRRPGRNQRQQNHNNEENHNRWRTVWIHRMPYAEIQAYT